MDYDFTNFSLLRELFKAIYYGEILIPGAEREQNAFNDELKKLERYRPRDSDFKGKKRILLINAQNFYGGRKMIIKAFKKYIFLLKNAADYPNYASDEGVPTSSSDLPTSSSPKGAIAAISRSSSDLLESFSPKSISSDLSKSSSSEDKPLDKFGELLIDLDKILDPELVDKYFYQNSLKKIVTQLKNLRHKDKELAEYNNKKALLVVGLLSVKSF